MSCFAFAALAPCLATPAAFWNWHGGDNFARVDAAAVQNALAAKGVMGKLDQPAAEQAQVLSWAENPDERGGAGQEVAACANGPSLTKISGGPWDAMRFRLPSLRNVTVRAPYMHGGSIADQIAVPEGLMDVSCLSDQACSDPCPEGHPAVAGRMMPASPG